MGEMIILNSIVWLLWLPGQLRFAIVIPRKQAGRSDRGSQLIYTLVAELVVQNDSQALLQPVPCSVPTVREVMRLVPRGHACSLLLIRSHRLYWPARVHERHRYTTAFLTPGGDQRWVPCGLWY